VVDVPAAVDRLDRAHRAELLALRRRIIDDVQRIWPAYDPANVDASWPALLAALTAITRSRHSRAVSLATDYLEDVRDAWGLPPDPTVLRPARPPDDDTIVGAMTLRGPIATKKAHARRDSRGASAAVALVRIVGGVTAIALDGDRATVADTVAGDPQAEGWRRVTDASPCKFCAGIRDEGVIAATDRGAQFPAHDHCGCTAAPVYRR